MEGIFGPLFLAQSLSRQRPPIVCTGMPVADGLKAEGIGFGGPVRPFVPKRRDWARLVKPDPTIELFRQDCLEIMAQEFRFWSVDYPYRPLQPRFAQHLDKVRPICATPIA